VTLFVFGIRQSAFVHDVPDDPTGPEARHLVRQLMIQFHVDRFAPQHGEDFRDFYACTALSPLLKRCYNRLGEQDLEHSSFPLPVLLITPFMPLEGDAFPSCYEYEAFKYGRSRAARTTGHIPGTSTFDDTVSEKATCSQVAERCFIHNKDLTEYSIIALDGTRGRLRFVDTGIPPHNQMMKMIQMFLMTNIILAKNSLLNHINLQLVIITNHYCIRVLLFLQLAFMLVIQRLTWIHTLY
jgi:hypothetical protein